MYGSQSFKHTSSKVVIHACPTDGGKRVFPSSVLSSTRQPRKLAASTDGYEGHGHWYRVEMDGIDGTVLSVQMNVTVNAVTTAASILLLRLRENADVIMVNANLGACNIATYQKLPVFFGSADVLSLREAQELGVEFPQGMLHKYFEEDEIEEDYEIVTISRGQNSDKPVIKKVGNKKVMVNGAGRRRVRVVK